MGGMGHPHPPDRATARRWTGDPTGRTALVLSGPATGAQLRELSQSGYSHARTGAITETDATPLLRTGWRVAEHLHLLEHDLRLPPAHPGARRSRRGSRTDLDAADVLDRACFPERWRLGPTGLAEALRATPSTRFRIVTGADGPDGYAICGRSGRQGYVQRLAVAPPAQGAGLGRALTLDGLRWLRRRRARSALVNTYAGNDPALRLYRSLGFVERKPGLMVLTIDL